ncbi:MAG: DNA polymerase, partial [Anaerolineales bacterium]
MYPQYKATRAKMPDDLQPQMERIRQIVDAMHFPRLELEGYEADDVLGSIARKAVQDGFGVKIITGDRDLLQLVDQRIVVNLPGKSLSEAMDYFPQDVVNYLGVTPQQVVDYKALVGDKSDNIPGVAGIGEKTAITLLNKYHDLDNIYAHLDEINESIRKKLIANKENAYLSRQLATIHTDLKIPFKPENAMVGNFDLNQIEEIFRSLEFRTLMTRFRTVAEQYGAIQAQSNAHQQLTLFPAGETTTITMKSGLDDLETVIVNTPEKLSELAEVLSNAQEISFDTETTSTDQMLADIVGISLACEPNKGYYIPIGHHQTDIAQLPLAEVNTKLSNFLLDPKIPKLGHNLKYDYVILARNGLKPAPLSFDSMIAEWLCDPSSHNLGLKNLAWVRLNLNMTSIEELIGKGKKQISMANVPIEQVAPYAAADAVTVLRLKPVLLNELSQKQGLKLFTDLEMPLVSVLADMEMAGITLDVDFLQGISKELAQRLHDIENRIYEAVDMKFNINSPSQLSDVLFKRLKIIPPNRNQKTASGFYSTAAGVLEELRGQNEVVDWILDYRELSKLKSTYVDALPREVNPKTGRVHTSYNQTGSVTGRLASSEPNLQNIPARSDIGRQVRQAFIASANHYLISADY